MTKIYSIILGNNNHTLYGAVNDAILIFNLFYTFYLKDPLWAKPIILLNQDVVIEKILNNIPNLSLNKNLIIYFSGHSCKSGKLKFHNSFISKNNIINNLLEKFKNNFKLFFIIDSCYSKNFYNKKSIKSDVNYILSSSEIQTSKEILLNYDENIYPIKQPKKKSKIIHGIFTFYFYKILNKNKLNDIKKWKNEIETNNIWKFIEKNYSQTTFYIES